MKTDKFIEVCMAEIKKKFPGVFCSYKKSEVMGDETHFILILPQQLHESDDMAHLQYQLHEQFDRGYFDGNLCFISSDSPLINILFRPKQGYITFSGQNQPSYSFKKNIVGIMVNKPIHPPPAIKCIKIPDHGNDFSYQEDTKENEKLISCC